MLLLGDTTSTQSLLFSPLLLPAPQSQPTYPNYTLPPAELRIPPLPELSVPQLDLLIISTGSSPTQAGLDNSLCAALNANMSTGALGQRNIVVNATTEWMSVGDEEGFRTYWVIGGLLPSLNYTAWFFEPSTRTLSQPIWFNTKQCKSSALLSIRANLQHHFHANWSSQTHTAPRSATRHHSPPIRLPYSPLQPP